MRLPWTARRSNQFILKEISPECSLEGLMLKLKLQYFGHLMRRADSFEKTLMLGKIGGKRRRGQRMSWLDGISDSMDMSLRTQGVGDAIQPPHPVIPFSSRVQSFPASGSFQMSQLFTSDGQSFGVSASTSVPPMNVQD